MFRLYPFILILLLFLPARHSEAQAFRWLETENDSSYISDYTGDLTVRLYGSRKFTSYQLSDGQRRLTYRPNGPFNLGFGFNYKFLGLNIGLNFPFINTSDLYGKTKFLDLQSHLYLRKLVIDFYGQYYKGYYLANTALLPDLRGAAVYIRPDLFTVNAGLSVQYIFNDRRFSFRSAYLQNEYQKKSSGSFLAGGDLHTLFIRGDSSVVPASMLRSGFFDRDRFTRSNVYCITANAGYAYTFVLKKHYFLTLSGHGGLGMNYTMLENPLQAERAEGVHGQLNTTWRIAAGYNSEQYFAGVHYVAISMRSNTPIPSAVQEFGAGNLRISFARRFKVRKAIIEGL